MSMFETTNSSNIGSIGFDNGVLFVNFKSGGKYKYEGVTEKLFEAFKSAPSAGKFFLSEIKDKFPCTRI